MKRRAFIKSGALFVLAITGLVRSSIAQPTVSDTAANVFNAQKNNTTNLLTNLLAFYRFDESAGANDALDASGNGRTLTQANSPGSAAGKINTSRTFSAASSQKFSRADESAMRFSGDFTITFFIQITDHTTRSVVSKLGTADPNFECEIYYYSVGDQWAASIYDTQGSLGAPHQANVLDVSAQDTSVNNWHFVAVRRFGSTLGIQSDGHAEVTTSTAGIGTIGGNGPFTVSSRGGFAAQQFLNGQTDLLGYWNRALSQAEITSLFNGGAGRDPVTNP